MGFVVPKHSHTAVERNQLKRRLRELARTRLVPAAASLASRGLSGTGAPGGAYGMDIVIRARRSAYDASFERLAADVDRVCAQLAQLAQLGQLARAPRDR